MKYSSRILKISRARFSTRQAAIRRWGIPTLIRCNIDDRKTISPVAVFVNKQMIHIQIRQADVQPMDALYPYRQLTQQPVLLIAAKFSPCIAYHIHQALPGKLFGDKKRLTLDARHGPVAKTGGPIGRNPMLQQVIGAVPFKLP